MNIRRDNYFDCDRDFTGPVSESVTLPEHELLSVLILTNLLIDRLDLPKIEPLSKHGTYRGIREMELRYT